MPKIRNKWYFLVEQAGKTVNEVCALYFVSRKTYYKWRSIDRGSPAYINRNEHPQTKLKGEIKQFVCEQKLLTNYGPKKMSLLIQRRFSMKISTTSIYELGSCLEDSVRII